MRAGLRPVLCVLATLTAFALALPASAEPEPWAYQLAHDLMSPFCPGRTLAECPSPQADELRIWILTQSAAGATREEVEAILVERFGGQLSQTPEADGWGLTAYAIPWIGALGGLVLAFVAIRRLVGTGSPVPAGVARPASAMPSGPPPSDVRLDAELERLVDEELARE